MIVSKELALKAGAGLATAAATSGGVYYVVDHYQNQITIFDQGLIDYLNNGGDIQFKIEKDSSILTTPPIAFPSDSSLATVLKISIKASGTEGTLVDKSSSKKGDKGHKDTLKDLNGAKDWTWICEIELKRDETSKTINDINDGERDKIFKTTNGGLFGDLKKDISSTDNKTVRELKKDFIKKCAISRTKEENRKINKNGLGQENEIKTPKEKITFELIKGASDKDWGTDATKLYFKDKNKFNEWFPTTVSQ